MNTKKAIEFVKQMANAFKCIGDYKCSDIDKKQNEIIALLQQGKAGSKELKIVKEELKKVWQMWEEFTANEGDLVKVVNLIKKRYEQKYFPKEKVIK